MLGIDLQPCKDCDARTVGCHQTCVKYQKLREYYDQRKKDRSIESDIAAYSIKETLKSKMKGRRK